MTALGMAAVALVAWPLAACGIVVGLRYIARRCADAWIRGLR